MMVPSVTPPVAPTRSIRWQFSVWWSVLLVLHGLCLVYFVGVGMLYKTFLPSHGSALKYQLRTYSIGIAETDYHKVALVHHVIAAIHAFFLLLMIGGSFRARTFVFYLDWASVWHSAASVGSVETHRSCQCLQKPDTGETRTDSSRLRRLSGKLGRVRSAIFSKHGLLGVDSVYVDHLTLVRQLVQTSLQTYQAYRMSRLLPRLWLARMYVLLVVINCWMGPILQCVYKKQSRMRRLMTFVCDVVLGLVSSMGISFLIFVTYVPEYNDPYFGFPLENFYMDEWFIRLYQDFQMMMVVSWSDMGSRLVFSMGVLLGMESIKELLMDTFEESSSKEALFRAVARIKPESMDSASPPLMTSRLDAPKSRLHKVVDVVLHVVGPTCFVLWGVILFMIHLLAEVHHVNLPCNLPLRPWLQTKPACSLVEIDCNLRNVSGSLDSLYQDWMNFEPTLAAGLVIRHCPNLTVPTTIQSFHGLITLKTYNSTITSWPTTAGLTPAHSRLRAIYLIRTNFTNAVFPLGLVRHDFPSTVSIFVASVTNIASLPDALDLVWPKRMSIGLEFATLTSVPDVLVRLNPSLVSFAHTPITSVPAKLFEVPALRDVILSYTAIHELPRNVTKLAPGFEAIAIEGTNVSVFWTWMDPVFASANTLHRSYFMAANTSYCRERDAIMKGTRQAFSAVANEIQLASVMDISTPSQLEYSLKSVTCVSIVDMLFPLALEDATSHVRG